MISKLFAAALVGSLTLMGPVAQAQKNEGAGALMATKMASAVPSANANAAEFKVFPDVPGLTAQDTGLDSEVHGKPDPTIAWLLAMGFLGVIVLRRTRSGPMI